MEGVARVRGGLLSVAEGGYDVARWRQEEKRARKRCIKVRKGHLDSSRKCLPLLVGRRYVASTSRGTTRHDEGGRVGSERNLKSA